MSSPALVNILNPDCISACFSFLSDTGLAVASSTNKSWHDEARKVAQERLKDRFDMASTPELSLENLATVRMIKSNYPAPLIAAIGLSRLLISPKLRTNWPPNGKEKEWYKLSIQDHRGPLLSGYDAQNNPCISFHVQMKSNPEIIITYNIASEATDYIIYDDSSPMGPTSERIDGPFKGMGRCVGRELYPPFAPFNNYAQEVLDSRTGILTAIEQIFTNQHPIFQLYSVPEIAPPTELASSPVIPTQPTSSHWLYLSGAVAMLGLTSLFFRTIKPK